jgi:hypothetical protein
LTIRLNLHTLSFMSNLLANLSVRQLVKAIKLREKIDALVNELNKVAGADFSAPFGTGRKKRKGMSAAGRARVAAAQKIRWAKLKGKTGARVMRKRKKMSAAARAKISAAAKSRWAKIKAAGKRSL